MGTLIQITDPHQLAAGQDSFMGVQPGANLDRVIKALAALPEQIDAVIVSGDIAQHPRPSVYQSVAERLAVLACPVYYLPGNHDIPRLMVQTCGAEAAQVPQKLDWGDMRVYLLDSSVPGFKAGLLGAQTLDWLELQLRDQRPCLIIVHHHPAPVGSAWIDRMSLKDAEALAQIVNEHSHVQAIVCGHVHQDSEIAFASTRQLSTPSTCRQFLPGSEQFAMDNQGPAWRWFRQGRAGLETGVTWLEAGS